MRQKNSSRIQRGTNGKKEEKKPPRLRRGDGQMLMDPERVLALGGAASRAGGEAVRRAPGAHAGVMQTLRAGSPSCTPTPDPGAESPKAVLHGDRWALDLSRRSLRRVCECRVTVLYTQSNYNVLDGH